ADDVSQRCALADKIAEGFGFDDGFLQVTVAQFELFFEAANFVESARIRDGCADVIRKDLSPRRERIGHVFASKSNHGSQNLSFEFSRLDAALKNARVSQPLKS